MEKILNVKNDNCKVFFLFGKRIREKFNFQFSTKVLMVVVTLSLFETKE
jgi:hypothetical protein